MRVAIRRFALTLSAISLLASTGSAQTDRRMPADDGATTPYDHRIEEARGKTLMAERRFGLSLEQTANQAQYDVRYYDLDLDLDPGSEVLTGTVLIRAEVLSVTLSEMDLDLKANMNVSSVTSGGFAAGFSRNADVLTVTLDRAYVIGEQFEVEVNYSGNPDDGPGGSIAFNWDNGNANPIIWTLSEPYGAREWWPCKDVNSDKADSLDIRLTVPDNLTAVTVGLLQSNVDNGSTRTFHWKTRYPINTYLLSLAIHPYVFSNAFYTPQGGGPQMEVQFYESVARAPSAAAGNALVVPMMNAFAPVFGEYPFLDEKYGHAEFRFGGGMEHQTCSSMGSYGQGIVAHELAHQWWGDMVTCADFTDIWLNEGFATWSEAYWREVNEGTAAYQSEMNNAAFYGPGTITVETPQQFNTIFDVNLSYNKASWVVHMLRGQLGDTDFFDGLAEYRSRYEYGAATTEQFRDAMEFVAGVDLDDFFNQWIYGEYFPVYRATWLQNGGTLDLTLEQTQTTGLFTLNVPIRVVTDQGDQDHVVASASASENYQLAVTGNVIRVIVDPDGWILKQVDDPVVNPTFAQGILLVNGVDWGVYGTEITSAYDDSTFWGEYDITFWDVVAPPVGGYPSTLPPVSGTGPVPSDILGQYSTVIWVGNDFNGDLDDWQNTAILSYLEAGGNVLLMTRRASQFVNGDLQSYLGITWGDINGTAGNFVAQYPGLINVSFIGTQSFVDVAITANPSTDVLFQATSGFAGPRIIGAHAQADSGGTYRSEGGHFALLMARPYRMNHTQLRFNVEEILSSLFNEPFTVVSAGGPGPVGSVQLLPSRAATFWSMFSTSTPPFALAASASPVAKANTAAPLGSAAKRIPSGPKQIELIDFMSGSPALSPSDKSALAIGANATAQAAASKGSGSIFMAKSCHMMNLEGKHQVFCPLPAARFSAIPSKPLSSGRRRYHPPWANRQRWR